MRRTLAVALALTTIHPPSPRPAEAADYDLGWAEAGRSGGAQQSATGTIKVVASEQGTGAAIDQAVVTIVQVGQQPRPTLLTGRDGRVEITDLIPGQYEVAVFDKDDVRNPRSITRAGRRIRRVQVKAGSVTTVEFTFVRAALVRGQVLTPEGRPVAFARVDVVPAPRTFRSSPVLKGADPWTIQGTTDPEGRFLVAGLHPDRYYVRVVVPPVNGVLMNYVYAPGVTSLAAATPFDLGSGDQIAIAVTVKAIPSVDVGGRVVDQQGRGVGAATLKLGALDFSDDSSNRSILSDQDGTFTFKGVRIGTHALRVTRHAAGLDSLDLVGAEEISVGEHEIRSLEVKVVPEARVTGRMFFDGVEQNDPARSEIRLVPERADAHLREGLKPVPEWRADGSFAVSGVLGRYRLVVLSAEWFVDRAFLEDGTDVADAAFDFQPGRLYKNVRVMLSDETALITGVIPPGMSLSPLMLVVFPADPTLWTDSRYKGMIIGQSTATALTVTGLPTGRNYLVAAIVSADDSLRAFVADPTAFLDPLIERAVSVFVDKPGKYTVRLPDPRR